MKFKFDLSVQNSNFLKGIGILLIITHNFFRKTDFSTCGENEFEFKSDRFINFLSSFDFPNLITYFGHYGVQLFIFISGYGLMKAYGNTKIQYFNFIKKRLIKLYPTFLISIIILYLYQFYILKWGYNSSTPFQDILLRVSLIANFVPGKIYVVSGPYWFYSMIVQLYLLFPVLAYIQKKKINSLWYIVLFSLVITSVFNAFFVSKNLSLYYNFFGNLPVFCLGMILASKKVYFNKLIWFIALLIFVVGQFNIYVWCLSQISFTIIVVPLLVKIHRGLKNGYISKAIIYTGSISMYLFAINGFLRFPWVNKVNDIGKESSLYLLFLLFILILFLSAILLNKIVKLGSKIFSVFEL